MIQTKQTYRTPNRCKPQKNHIFFLLSFIMFPIGHNQIIIIVFINEITISCWGFLSVSCLSFSLPGIPVSHIQFHKYQFIDSTDSLFFSRFVYLFSHRKKKMYSNWLHFHSHWIFCVILIIHGNVHTNETQDQTKFSSFFLSFLWFSMTINFSVGFSNGKWAEKN